MGLGPGGGEGYLGGIEKLVAVLFVDGSDEHAVAGAGDEVGDVFMAAEGRHGLAKGFGGIAFGGMFGPGFGHRGAVGLVPGSGTAGDGVVSEGGVVEVSESGGRGRYVEGFQHEFLRESWVGDLIFSPLFRGALIVVDSLQSTFGWATRLRAMRFVVSRSENPDLGQKAFWPVQEWGNRMDVYDLKGFVDENLHRFTVSPGL